MLTFVCGHPRSGTSLTMQMLHAAGLNCAGIHPAYETEMWVSHQTLNLDLLDRFDAVKWLDPHKAGEIVLPRCRVIWIDRDQAERAKSYRKTLAAFTGKQINRSGMRRAKATFRKEHRAALAYVDRIADRLLMTTFEHTLAHPRKAARLLTEFVGQGDPVKVASVVVERSPKCAKGMMEFRL